MTTPIKRVDWEALHAESLKMVRESMERAMYEKTESAKEAFYTHFYSAGFAAKPRIRYTVVLEWRGWKLLEVIEDVALGSEFYRGLPNGKRGLFGNCEEFTTASGDPGYLYHCIDED